MPSVRRGGAWLAAFGRASWSWTARRRDRRWSSYPGDSEVALAVQRSRRHLRRRHRLPRGRRTRTEMRALRRRHLRLPERGFQCAWPDASTARQRVLVRAGRPGPLADSCPARGSALSDRRSGQRSPRRQHMKRGLVEAGCLQLADADSRSSRLSGTVRGQGLEYAETACWRSGR